MHENHILSPRRSRVARFFTVILGTFLFLVTVLKNEEKYGLSEGGRDSLLVSVRQEKKFGITRLDTSRKQVSKFRVTPDLEFARSWDGYTGGSIDVMYLRLDAELGLSTGFQNCTSTLDVFAWLSSKMKSNEKLFVLAYGELLHFFREGDFVDKEAAKLLDDDFDLWVFPDTITYIIELEPYMLKTFGWSLRLFISNDYVVFVQLMALCGHVPTTVVSKVDSREPAIELYPLQGVNGTDHSMLKDLWQGTRLPENMVTPTVHVSAISRGSASTLYLQLPSKAKKILSCIYGNWTMKSDQHAAGQERCGETQS